MDIATRNAAARSVPRAPREQPTIVISGHDHHRILEHLKTPVDPPTWGPDWIKKVRRGRINRVVANDAGNAPNEQSRIVENLEKSRQVARYRSLYALAAVLALVVCALAMFVDYQIINGDVWTRALSDQFMQVPDALKTSVIFKSMQVIFAVLAVHFFLKITGKFGRNAMISLAFVLTIVMVGCLGYLVAYNNMDMGTSARLDHGDSAGADGEAGSGDSSIDRLLQSVGQQTAAKPQPTRPAVATASAASLSEVSLPLPKLSEQSLANAQGWFWLAFASVIFFIVTCVCALYMQIAENNVRNWLIARDYNARRREYDVLARTAHR